MLEMSGRRLTMLHAAAVGIGIAGVAVRLRGFGRYGFWNDEAWVALTTRVGIGDLWLAAGQTPLGWVALLRLAALGDPPEVWLRLLPLAFGLASLWPAWALGRRLGGDVAGLVALGAVALDPLGVGYAKELKQYSAEIFFALLSFERLAAYVARPTSRRLWGLALVLVAGLPFANGQLFVAPARQLAAVAPAVVRRDAAAARGAATATLVVAALLVAWYRFVIAPHVPPRLATVFGADFVPRTSIADAARFVWSVSDERLRAMIGAPEWSVGLAALAVAALTDVVSRAVAAGTIALVVALAVASLAGWIPFGTARVVLFAFTVGGAAMCAAIVPVVARLPRVASAAIGIALAVHAVAQHGWAALAAPLRIEDAGPLIRAVEAERGPDDVVLVYERSRYVWAYYQRDAPELDRVATSIGYVPRIVDPRVRLVGTQSPGVVVQRAFADAPTVWFLGSRLQNDAPMLLATLQRYGTVAARQDREDATLIRLVRRRE
jgi:hypothetical protein